MYYYAVLNEENVCITVDERNQPLTNPPENYIPIGEVEASYVQWKKFEDGAWSAESYEPEQEPEQPSMEDKVNYIYYKLMGVIA